MTTTYFGFAMSDSMFCGNVSAIRTVLTVDQVRELISLGVSCCNPSHEATIRAMRARYGIDIKIPTKPPSVVLRPGDSLVVMGVRGLPRLTDRHEYTDDEIGNASFSFAVWTVSDER